MWLGPHDGQVVDVSAGVLRSGVLLVPDGQRVEAHARALLTGEANPYPIESFPPGRYELRRASDGLADLDGHGRVVFEWAGWCS